MWFWLRRLVRQRGPRIQRTTAEKWDFRLSVFYGLVAWNAAGFALYMILTGRADWAKFYGLKEDGKEAPPSVQFADMLGIKKAHVIQISGLTKVGEFEIDETSTKEDASATEDETENLTV